MSHRNGNTRTSTALFPYVSYASAEFHFAPAATLSTRNVKITERRETTITERPKANIATLFGTTYGTTPPETTKKWSSEQVIEVEESYE
jgi:hypothetical protein